MPIQNIFVEAVKIALNVDDAGNIKSWKSEDGHSGGEVKGVKGAKDAYKDAVKSSKDAHDSTSWWDWTKGS